jgi:hypothetical protein
MILGASPHRDHMTPRLSLAIVSAILILTSFSVMYETYAVVFEKVTISIYLRGLADGHPQVYIFSGIVLTLLVLTELVGTHLPVIIRAIVLFWIFVLGHIFWGFCLQ